MRKLWPFHRHNWQLAYIDTQETSFGHAVAALLVCSCGKRKYLAAGTGSCDSRFRSARQAELWVLSHVSSGVPDAVPQEILSEHD